MAQKAQITSFNLKPGRILANKYEVISLLGQGLEGEVYKVRERRTNILRAAKLFFPHRKLAFNRAIKFAKKLHDLSKCSILIHYHTEDIVTVQGQEIPILISEYVEGILLSEFLKEQPKEQLHPYIALHLLYALTKGVEEIHLLNEYHGDLHSDNIIINHVGLTFQCKLVDLYFWPDSKSLNRKEDIVNLIKIFHEMLGGAEAYHKQPNFVKKICCGLKRSLILRKFRNISQLKKHLEVLPYSHS